MSKTFLLFSSPKPRGQARILIYRNWSIIIRYNGNGLQQTKDLFFQEISKFIAVKHISRNNSQWNWVGPAVPHPTALKRVKYRFFLIKRQGRLFQAWPCRTWRLENFSPLVRIIRKAKLWNVPKHY